jgi:hypothetical protein
LEKVVTSPTYDPTSGPVDPGVEQTDPRLGEAMPPGTFADSEMEYSRTETSGERYDQPVSSGSEEGSPVETAKSEAANVKDTAADAASGLAEVAKSEVSNVATEAKYQTRNLVDQTRSELRGQVNNQQSQLASKVHSLASELGSMAAKSDESGPMTDLAQEAARRGGEIAHWLDTHEPADVLDEVKRFARRRPFAFLALAAAAGVVAGRVTRGAVAANTSVDSDTEPTPARAYDSDLDDRGDYDRGLQGGRAHGIRSYQSAGYDPRYGEVPGETSNQGSGMPAPGQQYPAADTSAPGQYAAGAPGEYPSSTGPADPDVTPTTDETYYPPPAEGEVRR